MDSLTLQNQTETRGTPVEARLGDTGTRRRRRLEGQPQFFGDGRKWLPFQMLDPALKLIRGALALGGVYRPLARKATRIEVIENSVYLRGVTPSLEGTRILHLSDLHIDGSPGLGQRLAEACAAVDFDCAVITGDLRLEIRGSFEQVLDEMAPLLAVLSSCRYGAWAVLGNHDELDMVAPLEAMGLRYLINESTVMNIGYDRLYLAGVDDAHFFGTDDIDLALQNVPVDAPCVFLCHSPDLVREASERYCDLYLCGHTHGGQICLPGGKPIVSNASVPRRFCSGSWLLGGMRGYTSKGIGFSGVPFRAHCSAEIVIHEIRPERRGRQRIDSEEEAEKAVYDDEHKLESEKPRKPGNL